MMVAALVSMYAQTSRVAAAESENDRAKNGNAPVVAARADQAHVERTTRTWLYDHGTTRHHAAIRMGVLGSSIRAGLGYRLGVTRRLQFELTADHVFPHPGLKHLRGFTQTVGAVVWLAPTRSGLFLAPAIAVGEQFLVITPQRRIISLGGSGTAGLAFPVLEYASVELAAGLRRFRVVSADSSICTDPSHCELTRTDWLVDASLSVIATW